MPRKPLIGILISIAISATFLFACKSPPLAPETKSPERISQSAVADPMPEPAAEVELSNSVLPSTVRFEHLTVEDGLPHNSVRCILQDHQGYMWFGTNEGVVKYDGFDFTVYKHDSEDPNSLRENRVISIYQDRSSVLWAATEGGWLEKLERDTGRFTHYEMPSTVRAMHEDTEGVFWIGVDDPGLLQFDPESGESATAWNVDGIRSIFEDQDGVLWVGTEDGLLAHYDREQEQFLSFEVGYRIEAITQDAEGHLWIGTVGGGLAKFDPDSEGITFYQPDAEDPHTLGSNIVSDLVFDRDGVLWIGAYRSGLNRLEPDTEQFIRYQSNPVDSHSLGGNLILSLAQDRSGLIWVGTELAGISQLDTAGWQFSHFRHIPNDPNTLGSNAVTSILEDQDGSLWIGTRNGLSHYDPTGGQWRHFQNDPSDPSSLNYDYVGSLYLDQANDLWVGTGGSLDRYDREMDEFVHYRVKGPYGILQDHEGILWVSAVEGLYQYDRKHDRFILRAESPLAEGSYWSMKIHEDAAGYLWIGTAEEGLARYDPQTNEWLFFEHNLDNQQSLSHNFVEAILLDQSGVMWVGTHRGLDRFDPLTETFAHYGTNEGLPSDTVLGILQDEAGKLWLSTNQGLSRFDPQTETFRNYDGDDGLQGSAFGRGAYHQSTSGEMFFGGSNGFNVFFPQLITDNPNPPPIVITAFSLFNETQQVDLPLDEYIALDNQDNFISFDYSSLDFSNPEKNQYAYKMEGLDEEWIQAGNRRHADYPDLRPGDYTFRVIGSNSDGVWNEEGASVRITIKPPFWQTPWFVGLIIATLAGAVYGGYRIRVRSLKARSLQLEQEVSVRTTELQSANLQLEKEIVDRQRAEKALAEKAAETAVIEERSRLARDLHDAVTQTLFSASLIAEVLPRLWRRDPEEGERRLDELREMSRGALAEMRTLLLELRPAGIAEAPIADLLQQLAESTTGRARLPVELEIQGEKDLPPEVKVVLYRIAQEALNNVSKHANASQVLVRLSTGEAGVVLRIEDDGQGFELDEVTADHLGLKIMEERAVTIGAELNVHSSPGAGTAVGITWRDHGG